jgi:hypothetical protein
MHLVNLFGNGTQWKWLVYSTFASLCLAQSNPGARGGPAHFSSLLRSATVSASTTTSIKYVQGNYATPQTPETTVNVTFTGAQAAADLNVVVVGWNDSTAVVNTVTDSRGNTYTRAVGPTVRSGSLSQSIYYAKNIVAAAAGANTVTVTFSVAAQYPDIRILEYSGADLNNPIDVTVGNTGSSTTSNSGAVSTTNPTDLLFAANIVATYTASAETGFTSRMITSPDGDMIEDQMTTVAGSYSATAPLGSAGPWIMQMVAFRTPVSGGGNPTPPTAPVTPPFRVSSGATTAYTDPAGNVWAEDQLFSGGNVYTTSHSISGTQAQQVYQSERWSDFQYSIPIANGTYTVNLDFSENYVTGPGQRQFDVSINGAQVLTNFDIYAAAGGMYTAITKTFTAIVTTAVINITFSQGSIENPKVDGIEILPGSSGITPPSAPAITSATTASGTVGHAFSYQITATNSPTSYGATGLPSGLSINTATGLISGTPASAGTSTVMLSATNIGGTGNAAMTLTIASAPALPVITSATTASGRVGSAFSYQITATNTPTGYAATGLPTGLSVNTGSGVISGTPISAGTSTVTLSATNSAGTGNATLTLTVSSTGGLLLITPSSTNFGNVALNSQSTQPVVLNNTSASSITISQANVAGNEFSISGLSLPLTLAANQNSTFSVVFTPSSAGTVPGSVSLVSNATNSPTTETLSGTGIHVVDLSWQPSTSTVAGYNVYRGTVSAGPYTKVNSSLISGTTYMDATVQAGQTYYYVATAVDSNNDESTYSTPASAVVPSP